MFLVYHLSLLMRIFKKDNVLHFFFFPSEGYTFVDVVDGLLCIFCLVILVLSLAEVIWSINSTNSKMVIAFI